MQPTTVRNPLVQSLQQQQQQEQKRSQRRGSRQLQVVPAGAAERVRLLRALGLLVDALQLLRR